MKTYKVIDGPEDGNEVDFDELIDDPLYIGRILPCGTTQRNPNGSTTYFLYEVTSDDTLTFYKHDTVL